MPQINHTHRERERQDISGVDQINELVSVRSMSLLVYGVTTEKAANRLLGLRGAARDS